MSKKTIGELFGENEKILSSLNIGSTLSDLNKMMLPSHTSLFQGRQESIDVCEICNKNINNHMFFSLRKYEEVQVGNHLEDKLIECDNFCSDSCLKEFSDKHEETIEEYELYEVRRCSSYYDCLDLGNIRGICEKQERLDYEHGLLSPKLYNFCEPADAGIIKASINIKKQLDEGSKQNAFHFKLTAAMTVLVILLTIFNTYLILETNYEQQLGNIDTKLGAINNSLSSLNDQASNISSDLDSNTILASSYLLNTFVNTNQSVEFSNKS
jgi:hypothetical protein